MKHKIQIVFFGDSICFGQGISVHKGWVPRISQEMEEIGRQNGVEVMIVNAGVNGNTSRLALERMPYDIQSHNYDVIIVQFGMNDCNYWQTDRGLPRVSTRAFASNLHEIIDRAIRFGCRKVFLCTNHPTTRNEKMAFADISYQESNEAYNEIIRRVSRERTDAELIDIEAHIKRYIEGNKLSVSDIVLPDGIHLSLLGHDIYYDHVCPTIEGAVLALVK